MSPAKGLLQLVTPFRTEVTALVARGGLRSLRRDGRHGAVRSFRPVVRGVRMTAWTPAFAGVTEMPENR